MLPLLYILPNLFVHIQERETLVYGRPAERSAGRTRALHLVRSDLCSWMAPRPNTVSLISCSRCSFSFLSMGTAAQGSRPVMTGTPCAVYLIPSSLFFLLPSPSLPFSPSPSPHSLPSLPPLASRFGGDGFDCRWFAPTSYVKLG